MVMTGSGGAHARRRVQGVHAQGDDEFRGCTLKAMTGSGGAHSSLLLEMDSVSPQPVQSRALGFTHQKE